MNRLLQLRQDKVAALDQASAILSKMEAETPPRSVMTPEERTAFDSHHATAEGIQGTITAMERQQTATGNAHTDGRTGPLPGQVHDNLLDKPWGPEAKGSETKQERRRRLEIGCGEYMMAVKNAALAQQNGRAVDPRLMALNESFQRRAAAAGASESVPSDGGFLVYPDFADMLLELAHETGVIYPLTTEIPISEFTNAIKIPAVDEQSRKDGFRNGGLQMFWENEAQALVGSKPTFALLEMVLKKLTGLFYATNEILADTRLLGSFVMRKFPEELGFKLDDGVIRGTGAGQLSGILNAACLVSIAKETGQAAATLTTPNLQKMWARMWTPSRRNAVWLINQDVEQQLSQLTMLVGTTGGVPVFIPAGSGVFGALSAPPLVSANALAGMAGTLFGRPVFVVEQCATLGTVGDIILADFQQYLMIKKDGLQAATSMHVRFLTDELTYRWIYRTDGQPWFKTAITPAQGTNTLSPFVVLATRS